MITKDIDVVQTIRVTVDESKFDDKFMEEFRASFYGFDTLDEHLMHLAQLNARGLAGGFRDFIEGYGDAADMGIQFKHVEQYEEIAG